MRTLFNLCTLGCFLATWLISARLLPGAERTWTIATGVFTAQAELVAVRGDIVYLKAGERIEEYPIARLSVADQRYLASLALVPAPPGLNESGPTLGAVGVPAGSEETVVAAGSPSLNAASGAGLSVLSTPPILAPSAGGADQPAELSVLKTGPELAGQAGAESLPLPPGPASALSTSGQSRLNRSANFSGGLPQDGQSNQTPYPSLTGQSQNASGSNQTTRRFVAAQAQTSQSSARRGGTQQNQPSPGILGIRARRTERLRGR